MALLDVERCETESGRDSLIQGDAADRLGSLLDPQRSAESQRSDRMREHTCTLLFVDTFAQVSRKPSYATVTRRSSTWTVEL